jgi:hypothetical protein
MKLIHKVEESVVYESNKHSYGSILSSASSPRLHSPIKTFLLKISCSSAQNTVTATALLSNATMMMKNAYAHTSNSIKFKAFKVVPLKTFIDDLHSPSLNMFGMAYTLTLKLLADVGTQLEQIRAERNLVVPFLSLEDIIVIETHNNNENDGSESESESEYTFFFINAEKLMKPSKSEPNKKELIVDVPLKVNKHTSFLPAELPESALKRLPMRLSTTSWQYSLSALCIYALLQHKFKNGEDDIERVGRPFLHTSLYFCLKRCLKPDPEERVLLYV